MEIIKTFTSPDDVATITCPQCNKSRNIKVSKYRSKRHTIKVRCSCRYVFSVLLDFRKHYRKETNLDGSYEMVSPSFGKGRLNILNISRIGVGFTVGMGQATNHGFAPGQKMKIFFQLDNKKQSQMEKLIVIKTVNDHYIGGEFHSSNAFDKELGFYLQP